MNVLVISHSFIPSVLLCGGAQLNYLKNKGTIDYRYSRPHKLNSKLLTWADIIVFVRSESGIERHVSKICKESGKHLVYVMDDDLLNVPHHFSSGPYYAREDIKENIKEIMNMCDTFLTPSRVMYEKYGKDFKRRFIIEEPSLDAIDKKTNNKTIKIGFAGSIDRVQDLNEILTNTLTTIIEKYKDRVEVEFMGARPEIVDKYHLAYIPYTSSYEEYVRVIKERNWDIGLAPMLDTPFHQCKYFNKYVEYASFGIAGIYSNLMPYTFGVKDGINGLLVNNTSQEWTDALSRLIENDELRSSISKNSLEEGKTIYSLEYLSNKYLEFITNGFSGKQGIKIRGFWKFKLLFVATRTYYKVINERYYLPLWFINKIVQIITKEETYQLIRYKKSWVEKNSII